MLLQTKLSSIKGVGPKKYDLLKKLNLYTIEDFLEHYPRRYIDRRHVIGLGEMRHDMTCTVRATVVDIQVSSRFGRKEYLKIKCTDGEFFLDVIFFNARYVSGLFKINREYLFYGKVAYNQSGFSMTHPDFTSAEKVSDLFQSIQPVYPLTEGLSQKDMFKISKEIFSGLILTETLDDFIIKKHQLCSRQQAMEEIHFPTSRDGFKVARYRLIFEEFFLLQLGLLMLKTDIKDKVGLPYKMPPDIKSSLDQFIKTLPYEMTGAQKRVYTEILEDLLNNKVMNRLVQGDVGSGKTLIAMLAIYFSKLNGYQSALMVPTQILAEQHYESFQKSFKDLNINIALLTGSTKNDTIKNQIKTGLVDLVIGTHALIQDDVQFKSLGLAITDEQHRFGVNQRQLLSSKGLSPDVLVLTATPIPRTLSLILYGDIDISKVDEMPADRKPIKTSWVPNYKIDRMYDYIKDEVEKGRQCYIVYPLVEDSDVLDLKSVTKMYETLSKSVFRTYKTGMIHGKMKAKEKDAVMKEFEMNHIQILFATTVIEVGINVPNASIMVIEHAERFGLAQLHQLRGRVGRGEYQSYCFLISDAQSEVTKERLNMMTKSTDGFEIADKDLEIRGPGEVFGLKQHGLPEFKLGDLVKHKKILEDAQKEVKDYYQSQAFEEAVKSGSPMMNKVKHLFDQFTL